MAQSVCVERPLRTERFQVEMSSGIQYHGVGRRKSSVARVWLKFGTGKFDVNEKEYQEYFQNKSCSRTVRLAEKAVGKEGHFDIMVRVDGGGYASQADAVKLGVARALVELEPSHRAALREQNLLTVDSRVKERKKYGQKAARRKFQFVKR